LLTFEVAVIESHRLHWCALISYQREVTWLDHILAPLTEYIRIDNEEEVIVDEA
jgi:hypothetical protein